MSPWLKRLHLVATIGGGYTGIVVALIPLSSAHQGSAAGQLATLICLAVFVYGLIVGIRLAEGRPSRTLLLCFYGIQIPRLSSPLIVFGISAGADLNVGFLGDRLYFNWQIGANFNLSHVSAAPIGLGFNVLAIALMATVIAHMPSNNALERERGQQLRKG